MKENEPQKFQAKEAAAQALRYIYTDTDTNARSTFASVLVRGSSSRADAQAEKLHEFAKLATAAAEVASTGATDLGIHIEFHGLPLPADLSPEKSQVQDLRFLPSLSY